MHGWNGASEGAIISLAQILLMPQGRRRRYVCRGYAVSTWLRVFVMIRHRLKTRIILCRGVRDGLIAQKKPDSQFKESVLSHTYVYGASP